MLLFKATLVAESPFMIGNGTAEMTDNDVLVDRSGTPYIPGTTLAGVCRHYLQALEVDVSKIFGDGSHKDKQTGNESKIIFYDAFPVDSQSLHRSVRDSVKLANLQDDRLSSNPDNKFEYEVVEKQAEFIFRIELHLGRDKAAQEKEVIQHIIAGIQLGEIRIGAKTTRGFGKFKLKELKYKQIDLEKNFKDYLEINSSDDENGEESTCGRKWSAVTDTWETTNNPDELFIKYEYPLELKSFLSIRNYASLIKHNNKPIDAETLKNSSDEVVIPGTSWAGVFRQHCHRILDMAGYHDKDRLLMSLFGYVDEGSKDDKDNIKHKSQIYFEESYFQEGSVSLLKRTRTAIDRFTGGAADGALFTQEIACRKDGDGKTGKTTLVIRVPKKMYWINEYTEKEQTNKKQTNKKRTEMDDSVKKLIDSLIKTCIADLFEGHLVVGGQGSIGAGIFNGATKIKEGD
ncbi:RAMP superfamily CRISPR-associated protein [Aerococcaceae bacterium NML130460]|nr:RAMP superfamily CRISPR-associated protein [Aerococcaceae bacterium NML130460]